VRDSAPAALGGLPCESPDGGVERAMLSISFPLVGRDHTSSSFGLYI
jgi:hypothetical protein